MEELPITSMKKMVRIRFMKIFYHVFLLRVRKVAGP